MSELEDEPIDTAGIADDWAAALTAQQGVAADMAAQADAAFTVDDQPLPPGSGLSLPKNDVNLDVILDVPVTIAMEIGRSKISIRNLLQLNQGSVVELDRLAGEPLDVFVNSCLIAHGEVVVVNDKFGIRLTDVISPTERIKKLK
ncbi:flagellar motor switch protein FliN [Methylogaea oryzae]|uniref:Flagellar motor switch protein FliN n=1 Tax=Methylogaea oryzae TaxID=1295382 RepID=A0A8D5AKV0_9GAMM|nr:flagellar motor switch protein FliN [Methylogaea oryzae]BBL71506.1 flagellar motor switch protein FliN [Methylogaea oryzae]